MNNEEKSTQVAIEFSSVFPSANSTTVHDLVLAMAEWKDAQFKEYLEKKIEPFIRTNASPQGTYQEGFDDGYTSAIDEIINELFGGE